jgi:hypothetical protein
LTCFGVSTLLYLTIWLSIDTFRSHFEAVVLPIALIVYQTINFHHYIVDALIWKLRRKEVREKLSV